MLELELHVHTETFELDDAIVARFDLPVLFYLHHSRDERNFFATFVIMDAARRTFTYYTSYTPANRALVEASPDSELYRNPVNSSPHTSMIVDPARSFCTFTEKVPYFHHVDFQRAVLTVYTAADFDLLRADGVRTFSATNAAGDDGSFYFTGMSVAGDGRRTIHLYRATLDLSAMEKLYEYGTTAVDNPHQVERSGRFLLLSVEFYNARYRMVDGGEELDGRAALYRHVLERIDRRYCAPRREARSSLLGRLARTLVADPVTALCRWAARARWRLGVRLYFLGAFLRWGKGYLILKRHTTVKDRWWESPELAETLRERPDLHRFLRRSLLGDLPFRAMAMREPGCRFELMPGRFHRYDLETGEVQEYTTTRACPAHFVVDPATGDVVVSSHSIIYLDRFYFCAPAALDRFRVVDGILEKVGTFCDPTGYRFTSHAISSHDGKSFLVTFGQPNRLFVVDGETMEKRYHHDIGRSFLEGREDIDRYLNDTFLEHSVILGLFAPAEGDVILFIGPGGVSLYDITARTELARLPFLSRAVLFGTTRLDGFYLRTTHTQYLG